jgi:hypothetical protein
VLPTSGQTARQGSPAPKPAPEVSAAAQTFWNKVLRKCGDSYYYAGYSAGTASGAWIQYKTPSFSILPGPISPADRLNGKEWQGRLFMTASLVRVDYFVNPRYSATGGFEWFDGTKAMSNLVHGLQEADMEKRDGLWSYRYGIASGGTADEIKTVAPSCEDFAARQQMSQKTEVGPNSIDNGNLLVFGSEHVFTLSLEQANAWIDGKYSVDCAEVLRAKDEYGWTDLPAVLLKQPRGKKPVLHQVGCPDRPGETHRTLILVCKGDSGEYGLVDAGDEWLARVMGTVASETR